MFKWSKILQSNNSNNLNRAIIKGNSKITINGKTYQGSSVNITNNKVIIDGEEVDDVSKEPVVYIDVYPDKGSKVENVNTVSGDITIHGNATSIKTTSGDVLVNGNISGNINTVSGDVKADNIDGNINTVSGDIIEK